MLWALGWTTAALAAPCGLAVVVPAAGALQAPSSGGLVPRDTLVEHVLAEDCTEGMGVRLRALPDVYRAPADRELALGATTCIDPALLARPDADHWLAVASPGLPPGAGPDPGLLLGPLVGCDAETVRFGASAFTAPRALPLAAVGNLRPLSAATLAALHGVQAAAMARVGPVDLASLSWSFGGRVRLPLVALDPDERAAEHRREALLTADQQSRALTHRGPGAAPAWLHFTGTDPLESDAWGTPAAVSALIALAADWRDHCAARAAADPALDPAACVLQVGDLAYYDDRRPDPLGHKDHFAGNCVDLRLFRSDASRYEAWWNRPDDRPGRPAAYSRSLTAAFVDLALARDDVDQVLFNDPAVAAATPARGHDDHLHLCFRPPAAPEPAPGAR